MKNAVSFCHLGFPIQLLNWPHLEVEGELVPDINYVKLENIAYQLLAIKPTRLSGAELKFIRLHLDMTQKQFSHWLDDQTDDSTISKWESADLAPTGMSKAMERSIRMQLIVHILELQRKKTIRLGEVMARLSNGMSSDDSKPIELDAEVYFPLPDRPPKDHYIL